MQLEVFHKPRRTHLVVSMPSIRMWPLISWSARRRQRASVLLPCPLYEQMFQETLQEAIGTQTDVLPTIPTRSAGFTSKLTSCRTFGRSWS